MHREGLPVASSVTKSSGKNFLAKTRPQLRFFSAGDRAKRSTDVSVDPSGSFGNTGVSSARRFEAARYAEFKQIESRF